MRQLLVFSLLFTLIFGTSYWYTSSAYLCPIPIKYGVGEIDDRFLITKEEVRDILLEAEAVWEGPTNRDLFVYDKEAAFMVNFVFDERQQLVRTEEEWRTNLDEQERIGLEMAAKVKNLSEEYKRLEADYLKQRALYESQLDIYNKKVESYNEQGGVPREVFAEMKQEQDYLSGLLSKLVSAEQILSQTADDINTQGEQSNKIIEDYNAGVERYNEIFGSQYTFTQGDFRRERINIYKFTDKAELVRVMAHELGHALGISHVEEEESVMYYLTKEQLGSTVLSIQDLEALVDICGDGTELSHKLRKAIRVLLSKF